MDYLKLFEQQIDRIIGPQVNELINRRLNESDEPVGREFQHIEDLVYIYGPAGAKRAIDRIASIGKNSQHMELKWDGSPAIIFGRDENGTFHFGDKYSKEIIGSGKDVYNQYVGRSGASVSDDRKKFAGEMSSLYDVYEAATPKDFRGFLEGALLYKSRPPQNKHGEYYFQPNTVIYYVAADSDLGKRIAQSVSASTATAYFDALPALGGQRQAVGDRWKSVGNADVIILPPKFATDTQADIPEEAIQNLYQYLAAHKSKIEKFVTPSAEWNATFKNPSQGPTKWREVIYKYVNSQVDNPTGLENLGSNMAQWAEGDPILAGGKRREVAINDIKNAGDNLTATFRLVRGIMRVKDEVVDQLENPTLSSIGIRAELPGGAPGGEGFVSDPSGGTQPLKFVKRGTFTAANRQKGRVGLKENTELFDLKFNTVSINENQIYDYFKSKHKKYKTESFPQRMVSGIKKLRETDEHKDIKPFIDKLIQLDFPKKIKVGDKLSVLDFEISFAWKEVDVRGFTTPKTITKISHSDGKINYIEFDDGDRYPRQTPATYSGRPMEYAVYFKKSDNAGYALTELVLMLPDGWDMNISEVKRDSSIKESTDKNKTAVVGWGRGMGHSGHMYLADSVIHYANKIGGTPFFYVSETVGKDDPLTTSEKLEIYRTVFPENKNIFKSGKSPIDVITQIYESGYSNLVFIVGEDQKDSFQFLARPTKSTGELPVPFDSVKVISRQETGSSSASKAGPRATPMREILRNLDATTQQKFKMWRSTMPRALSDEQVMHYMSLAAKRMGVPISDEQVDEADNPNNGGAGGGSASAIPGTPPSLQPQPTEDDERRYHKEMQDIKRFMSGR